MFLRIIVFIAIVGAIFWGIRSITKDWQKRFRDLDEKSRERDLRERQRPDVIELKRSEDGVYRPGEDDEGQGRS